MSADLDALLRPPDEAERWVFAIENCLHLIEDCRANEAALITTFAHALADADEDAAKYRAIKPPDLDRTLADIFTFLHGVHERYVTEREAARAARELLKRRDAAA